MASEGKCRERGFVTGGGLDFLGLIGNSSRFSKSGLGRLGVLEEGFLDEAVE